MRDWAAFHALAAALSAEVGGTAAVCDDVVLPRACLVGSSGTLVAPRAYLALGISGAPHHLYGAERAGRIVAVQLDPYAAIVEHADVTVVCDVQPLLAELVALAHATPPTVAERDPVVEHPSRAGAACRLETALHGRPRAAAVAREDAPRSAARLVMEALAGALPARVD